jgi:hypothetical protein
MTFKTTAQLLSEFQLLDIHGNPIREGGNITYTIPGRYLVEEQTYSEPEIFTFPVVKNSGDKLCLLNEQGVQISIESFMKYKPEFTE